MDTGTGVTHPSEAICNMHHANGRSADVPGSAHPLHLPHDCTGNNYGTLQAGGSSTVIQGNVTVNYTHPQGGRGPGDLGVLFRSKTSGDTDPLHKPRNLGLPRAHTLGCLRTFPYPESFSSQATPSFARLHDVGYSVQSSIRWKANSLQEVIEDNDKGETSFKRYCTPRLSLETQDAVRGGYQLRRLNITTTESVVRWLPDTRVRVALAGHSVVAWFSNCNKLQSPGPYATDNGRRKSVATYDPEAPNVRLEITFASVEEATEFRRILLCLPLTGDAVDHALRKFGNCTFMHQSHEISDEEPKDITLVWKQETDLDGKTYQVHDKISFSDILDLDMNLADEYVRLSFGYMDRLQYRPARDHPKLPQNVKLTPDGGPGSVTFEGAESPTSRFELVTLSTDLEVQQFLRRFAGDKISWQFEAKFLERRAIFSRRKIKISWFSRGLSRVLSGSREYLTQVTLWSNGDKLRILMRAVDPGGRNELRRHLPRWFAITLEKNGISPTARLKQSGEIVLTIEKIGWEAGSYLSTKDLKPMTAYPTSTETHRTETKSVYLELKFANESEWTRFRNVVSDAYLDVTRQRGKRTAR